MEPIRYSLTDDDLQLLYPLCTVGTICALFPEHAPSHWTIRRRYKRLGLPPINSAHKSFVESLQAARHADVTIEEWSAGCDRVVQQMLDEQVAKIWKKIHTVESRGAC